MGEKKLFFKHRYILVILILAVIFSTLLLVHRIPISTGKIVEEVKVQTDVQEGDIVIIEDEEYHFIPFNGTEEEPEIPIMVPATEEEISYLCQLVYGEGRGLNKTEMSAIIWCVLNRVDSAKFPNTIKDVIFQPGQFYGDKLNFPIKDNIKEMVHDVLTRWVQEKQGEIEVGRTLPETYVFYFGDGKHNYFREEYKSKNYYQWNLKSPY